ncbi:MAG: HlyD family secretion protein [Hyphomicrobiaceae bacterium]
MSRATAPTLGQPVPPSPEASPSAQDGDAVPLRSNPVPFPAITEKPGGEPAGKAAPAARVGDDTRPAQNAVADKPGKPRRRIILGLIGALALVAAVGFGVRWWTVGRFLVSTDDAYIGADISLLSARVAARVVSVTADANQHVKTGDELIRLDDADFKLGVDQANARLATQQAGVARMTQQILAGEAAVAQARAQVVAAEAETARAEADFVRVQSLAANQYSSRAAFDQARAARDKARAAEDAARAALKASLANVAVLEAQKTEAQRMADELAVAVAKAKRDLEATSIRAPIDGVVGNKSVQVGDYVTPGKRLAAIVPLDHVYIDAKFQETQLAGIHQNAKATISVDAADAKTIEGKVISIAPATGSQFSLLPPENATGNFTKIVQRVPVRIAVPRQAVESGALRPGLSVVVTIDTRTGERPPLPAAKPEAPIAQAPSGHTAQSQ